MQPDGNPTIIQVAFREKEDTPMRTATLIVGGVFSYIGIMFFAALEASTAAPIPAALNPAPSADTLESGLVTVSHADTWSQCLPKN